jgi:hypothetical protein
MMKYSMSEEPGYDVMVPSFSPQMIQSDVMSPSTLYDNANDYSWGLTFSSSKCASPW